MDVSKLTGCLVRFHQATYVAGCTLHIGDPIKNPGSHRSGQVRTAGLATNRKSAGKVDTVDFRFQNLLEPDVNAVRLSPQFGFVNRLPFLELGNGSLMKETSEGSMGLFHPIDG
jgi:hypothetical protein